MRRNRNNFSCGRRSLALAQPLPTLPLWIAPDFSVPLDLEASYQMTCADLRIHQAPDRLFPTAESD